MEDILEFEKINKLNIPIHSEFDYYIKTLSLSIEFNDIYNKIKAFESLEDFAYSNGYKSAKSYKLDYALPVLKKYIEGTEAYKLFNAFDYSKEKFRTKDTLLNNVDSIFISIDFRKANYSILKTFDIKNELFESWDELCNKMNIHNAIRDSKSFRQYLFGNLNPSRATKLQHLKMLKLIEELQNKFGINEADIVFISHDEFIIKIAKKDKKEKGLYIDKALRFLYDEIPGICKKENIPPVSFTIFELENITSKIYKKSIYDIFNEKLELKYESLMSCPANKFFKYFKKNILNGTIDRRDLTFMNDGEIATWQEDEDSIDTSLVPEGELSLEEIKRDYGHFYNKIKTGVPGLNERQIRKVIDISLSLCPYCYEYDRGCQCWNDD